MDPLSVSASIVSLIGVADTVVRRLYKYIKAAKGAEKDIANLSLEITTLYGVLSSLHLVASRFESEVHELSTQERSMQIDHIHACYRTLDSIRSLLGKDDPSTTNSKMESVRRRLHWPLSESKTKALIDDVGKHKQTLALALSADTMAAMLQGLSQQKDMSSGINDIRHRMLTSSMTETRRKVLRSFAQSADPQRYLSAALRVRQMGTGLWICENKQFQAWMSSNSSRLYVSGIPGAGKTVLTATIIEEVSKCVNQGRIGSAVAYYFCDYKDPTTQDSRSIIASLAGQLASQDEQCFAIAEALYHNHYPSEGSATAPGVEDFKQCLLNMTKTLDHAYIIVDALDECTNDRATMLETLHSLNDSPNDCIKTLFTGREEIDIQRALDDYDRLSIAASSHDIRLYVDSEIARRTKNRTLRIRDPALQEEIRERLVSKAEGMFRWVTCQIDHICALSNDKSRRKALDTLPPDLPTTYERVLAKVNASNEENQIMVQRTLRWILWGTHPLSLAALSEAVSVSIHDHTLERDAIVDPESILQWCGSLVRRTPGADTLELAHYSVKEYLEHIDVKAFPQYTAYRADVRVDSLELAKTCLTYLCFDNFDLAQKIDDPRRLRSFMTDYKFLRYCVQSWDEHAQVVEDDDSLLELLQGFMNTDRTNQYLAWMSWMSSIRAEVLDPERPDALEGEVDYRKAALLFSRMADSSPLHWAAALSLPTMCRLLIAKGCNVNQASTFFGRPLLAAVAGTGTLAGPCMYTAKPWELELGRRCQYQTVKVLLEAGADCNAKVHYMPDSGVSTEVESSALSKALTDEPDWNIVRLLLDSGTVCDRDSLDVLSRKEGGGFEIFQKLTEHNIEESQINHFRKLAIDADLGWDRVFDATTTKAPQRVLSGIEILPLFLNAAKFGRLHVMENLAPIVAKASNDLGIDAVDEAGSTALHVACRHNHPEIVKVLIREGIDIDKSDASGLTALMIASEEMSTDCAKILLEHGANVRVATKNGITALHKAAAQRTSMMLETILESPIPEGPSLYTRTKKGHTLLHDAAFKGSLPTIEYILKYFEDASVRDLLQHGSTCLHRAALSGSLPAVAFFVDNGLSPNHWNDHGKTPVFSAIEAFKDSFQIIKFLHSRGADLDAIFEKTGDIPLFHQIGCLGPGGNANMMDCLNYLLDHTADINHCNKAGDNAFHWLAAVVPNFFPNAYLEFAYLALIKRGCSMTKYNAEGHSPFQRFVMNWSEVELDASGLFRYRYKQSYEGKEFPGAPEYEGIRAQVGMIMFILKHTKVDVETLGPPDKVQCRGASLLSLAMRTNDQTFVKQVLEYDSDVDRRDTPPGFGTHPLNTPVEWLCTGFVPNVALMKTILSSSKMLEKHRPDGFSLAHIAAWYGNVEVLEELLNMGIQADCLSSDGRTPLMCACSQRRFEVIRLLYERGARRAVTEVYDSLLVACEKGDDDVLSTLFDMPELNLDWGRTFKIGLARIAPKTTVVENMDYFHYAVYHGRRKVLDWLLDAGLVQDVNSVVGEGKFTALYLAARHAVWCRATLPILLSKGADVHLECTERRWTALHAAAQAGNTNAIGILLAHGADASARDSRNFTPQLVAIDHNQLETAQRLLEHTITQENRTRGLHPNDNRDSTDKNNLDMPLHSCAKAGQVDMMRKLLDDGADINARAYDCTTPVMKAVRGGHLEALDLLRERGANFMAKDLNGWSALHHACFRCKSLAIPGLLELGLRFTDSDLQDETPLHFCTDDEGLQDLVKTVASPAQPAVLQLASLIDRLAFSESKSMVLWTLERLDATQKRDALNHNGAHGHALHIAASQGAVEMLEILLDAGAEIDRWIEKMSFPLACAATMGRFDAVQLLARKGAKIKHVLPDGTEQCGINAAKEYPKIQQWLRDFYHLSADQTG